MKKIKELLPLWLVLLFFGSVYFMLTNRSDKIAEYQRYVKTARTYAENEVVVDSIENYRKALSLEPSPDLYVEAGDVYLKYGKYRDAQNWYGNEVHLAYPDAINTYEFGIRAYLAEDNYRGAFQVYEECKERELVSDGVRELIQPIEYEFNLWGEYKDVRPFGNSSRVAAVCGGEDWGYISTDGSRVLDYIYKTAGTLRTLAAVVDEEGDAYFLDSSGNKRITEGSILEKDPEMGSVKQFLGIESDKLWAYNGKIWNCYSSQTLERLFGGYAGVTNILNGVGAVQNADKKWALISSEGVELTDFIYDEIMTDQKSIVSWNGSVIARQGDEYLLLNQKGERVGGTSYEAACPFYDSTRAAVKKDGKWLYIDGEGNEQDLGEYEEARSFSNGYAAVKKDGKWGYIDTEGTLVINCQFDDAAQFGPSGVAFVKTEDSETWTLLSLYKDNYE